MLIAWWIGHPLGGSHDRPPGIVIVLHSTFCVNSFAQRSGRRRTCLTNGVCTSG
jgi:hypothetical protein